MVNDVSVKLFPFQEDVKKWLLGKLHALVCLEMGLGKTAISIKAAEHLGLTDILILAPAIGVENWKREISVFSPNFLGRLLKTGGVKILSYDKLIRAAPEGRFQLLILDECHYLKTPEAKRTLAVFGSKGVARRATRVWALSGTPAPNNAAELWVLLRCFGRTRLSYDAFVREFCHSYSPFPGKLSITGTKKEKIPELGQLLRPIIMRRTKEEVMPEMPPITIQNVLLPPSSVPIPEHLESLKEKFVAEAKLFAQKLGGFDLSENATLSSELLSTLASLAQSVPTLRRYLGIQKAISFAPTLVQELQDEAMNKVVIFAIHRDVIEILRSQFQPECVAVITGDTPQTARAKEAERFQKDPKCRVFIGNILAAGTTITLTASHHVVMVEMDWVPGNNAQAMMRVHRIGQKFPVLVRTLSISNSLDEKLTTVLARKSREIALVFDSALN